MANKVTKKDNFKAIIEVLKAQGKDNLVEVMEHEIELIEKKRASGKMTKTQEANETIKDLIIEEMTKLDRAVTITELINESQAVNEAVGGSNQKTSALMTQLKNANRVVRIAEGKKATFKVVE